MVSLIVILVINIYFSFKSIQYEYELNFLYASCLILFLNTFHIFLYFPELLEKGLWLPPEKARESHFDSNCITPGTPFMAR
jgi:hypothetical protein